MSTKDALREAIQVLSTRTRRRLIYGHTGWRQLGGQWVYLHGGGAIGPVGPVCGEVDLPMALAGAVLPLPPQGEDLARAVRASAAVLDLGPERIMVPLLGCGYRAVLGGADFSAHLAGPTGVFKSELATLAQQHFGAGFDARHLPGSWSSTANALEALEFIAKDMVVVVDDYAPTGSTSDIGRLHQAADRVFRGAGNRSSRMRMAADGTLRPPRPPRCTVLSTGEDVPPGQSLRARVSIIEIGRNDIDVGRLTQCQNDAAAGLYAQAMAAYLHWLAPQYAQVQATLRTKLEALRDQYADADAHRRTPGVLADLGLGWQYFLRFAEEAGALTAEECADLAERVRAGLVAMGKAQAAPQQDAEPAAMFLRLLLAVISSGRGHVASPHGDQPTEHPTSWGWQQQDTVSGPPGWKAQGRCVGWVDGGDLYLSPESAYAEANRLAQEQGKALPVSVRTLGKRLHEQGHLASIDRDRDRLTVRRMLVGVRQNVWHLSAPRVLGVAQTVPTVPSVPQGGTTL
jgi:hypothetical protein